MAAGRSPLLRGAVLRQRRTSCVTTSVITEVGTNSSEIQTHRVSIRTANRREGNAALGCGRLTLLACLALQAWMFGVCRSAGRHR